MLRASILALFLLTTPAHAEMFPGGDDWLVSVFNANGDEEAEWPGGDPAELVCGPYWDCANDLNRDGEHDNPPQYVHEPDPCHPTSPLYEPVKCAVTNAASL